MMRRISVIIAAFMFTASNARALGFSSSNNIRSLGLNRGA
jgi:hypothetical protein